jgi:hypothetical protein
MTQDVEVIWRKGDGAMPTKVQTVVDAAQNELLLETLHLSSDIVNTIKYNSEKSSQTISEYISLLVTNQLKTA